jgi:beta-lactamase class A
MRLSFPTFFILCSGFLHAQTVSIQEKLASLEATFKGRLGVYAYNTANNEHIQYRGQERFPMCSTSKVMTVAAILKESEHHPNFLSKKIIYKQKDLDKEYSPITPAYVSKGMTVQALSVAAIKYSDNTAMNLLMNTLGGPKVVTAFARSIHDPDFRLDRWEPELNSARPNDPRDTTTPSAMANSLKNLVLGNALAPSMQQHLKTWLQNNTTGNARIRSAVPRDWIVGDKTGTCGYGSTNDIAIIWPSKCKPLVLAVYFTQNKKNADKQEQIIAQATAMVLSEFAKTDPCIYATSVLLNLRRRQML